MTASILEDKALDFINMDMLVMNRFSEKLKQRVQKEIKRKKLEANPIMQTLKKRLLQSKIPQILKEENQENESDDQERKRTDTQKTMKTDESK